MKTEGLENISSVDEAYSFLPGNVNIIFNALEINKMLMELTGSPSPKNWSAARGLKVLDLGCGSNHIYSFGYPVLKIFTEPPYFCRMLVLQGASVWGIDKYPATEEPYTHIVADLVAVINNSNLSDLPELSGQKFDAIHSSRLFDDGAMTEPELEAQLEHMGLNLHDFRKLIKEQTPPLLKENGIIQFNNQCWRKTNGIMLEC